MDSCPYIKKNPIKDYKPCDKKCPILEDKPLCKRWDLCTSARHHYINK